VREEVSNMELSTQDPTFLLHIIIIILHHDELMIDGQKSGNQKERGRIKY
jgi:hypothetical protein